MITDQTCAEIERIIAASPYPSSDETTRVFGEYYEAMVDSGISPGNALEILRTELQASASSQWLRVGITVTLRDAMRDQRYGRADSRGTEAQQIAARMPPVGERQPNTDIIAHPGLAWYFEQPSIDAGPLHTLPGLRFLKVSYDTDMPDNVWIAGYYRDGAFIATTSNLGDLLAAYIWHRVVADKASRAAVLNKPAPCPLDDGTPSCGHYRQGCQEDCVMIEEEQP